MNATIAVIAVGLGAMSRHWATKLLSHCWWVLSAAVRQSRVLVVLVALRTDGQWSFALRRHAVVWFEGLVHESAVVPLRRHVLDVLAVVGLRILCMFALRAHSSQSYAFGDLWPQPWGLRESGATCRLRKGRLWAGGHELLSLL